MASLVCCYFVGEHPIHDLDDFAETSHALSIRPCLDSCHGMTGIASRCCANPHVQSPVRNVVNRERLPGKHSRVSIDDICDQGTDANPTCPRCESSEECPAIEPIFPNIVRVDKVIGNPETIVAK